MYFWWIPKLKVDEGIMGIVIKRKYLFNYIRGTTNMQGKTFEYFVEKIMRIYVINFFEIFGDKEVSNPFLNLEN